MKGRKCVLEVSEYVLVVQFLKGGALREWRGPRNYA